jgi:hypothetical protein
VERKRPSQVNIKAVDELIAHIANTPLIERDEVIRKAKEMGYNPRDLTDAALGSVMLDKRGGDISGEMEDVLNRIYSEDPTPGTRSIVDPSTSRSKLGRELSKRLEGGLGMQTGFGESNGLFIPEHTIVKEPSKDLIERLSSITNAGHELKHGSEYLGSGYTEGDPRAYKLTHHAQGIYEPDTLIKEIKNTNDRSKEYEMLTKRARAAGVKANPFIKLLGILNPLAITSQGVSALADIKEGNPNTAAAKLATSLAPMGAGQLEDNLMEEAAIKDKYPKLQDPTYLRTIKNIGERRQEMGKSPIVEGFDNEQIDTSQTENSMFENLMKKIRQEKSRG